MATEEIFESTARESGDLAGVFEYDGETAYFYLYRADGPAKILAAIHVLSGDASFGAKDVVVSWNRQMDKVGLFISGELWAVFEADKAIPHGGNYLRGARPGLPAEAASWFA